jgi:hypothetical protein
VFLIKYILSTNKQFFYPFPKAIIIADYRLAETNLSHYDTLAWAVQE